MFSETTFIGFDITPSFSECPVQSLTVVAGEDERGNLLLHGFDYDTKTNSDTMPTQLLK